MSFVHPETISCKIQNTALKKRREVRQYENFLDALTAAFSNGSQMHMWLHSGLLSGPQSYLPSAPTRIDGSGRLEMQHKEERQEEENEILVLNKWEGRAALGTYVPGEKREANWRMDLVRREPRGMLCSEPCSCAASC